MNLIRRIPRRLFATEIPVLPNSKIKDIIQKQDVYCILELYSKPHQVSKNDIIVANKMKLNIGDVVELNRIREVGTSKLEKSSISHNDEFDRFVIQGNPFIDGMVAKAVVLEHSVSKDISRLHQQRSGHSKTVVNQTHHTLLRIVSIEFNKQ